MSKVWAVAQHRDGKLHRGSLEVLGAAQKLAERLGGTAEAVILGSSVGELASALAGHALEAVRTLEADALASYTPGGYVAALGAAIGAERPDFVLLPHTYQSSEYVPRLAQAIGAALLPEAIALEGEGAARGEDLVWKRPILEGKLHAKVRARGAGPTLVSLQSGAFSADSRKAGRASVEAVALDLQAAAPWREILGVEQMGGDTVDLTKADIIVSIGRGVGGADKMAPVEELARLLKAEIGASRPVIDSGWLPRDRQIGSSGQTVSPKLYLAFGISGAIQHLVGMKGSTCIVAVNKDAGAPIFKIANYGIVGDLHEVVPAMITALKEG